MAKTLAERKFNERTKKALETQDFTAVEKAYNQYGTYLELVGKDTAVGEVRAFEWIPEKRGYLERETGEQKTVKHEAASSSTDNDNDNDKENN